MNEITDEKQQTAAKEFKKNISIYLENRDLIPMEAAAQDRMKTWTKLFHLA